MSGTLAGKVALVTGASSGIGEATALALAEAGTSVAVSARRADRLADLVERIEAAGGKALALPGDVSDEVVATQAVEDTVQALGRLDILTNSAGVIQAGGVENADSMTNPAFRGVMKQHVLKEGAMAASGVADAIVFVVTLPPRANVSQLLIRPIIDTAPMQISALQKGRIHPMNPCLPMAA